MHAKHSLRAEFVSFQNPHVEVLTLSPWKVIAFVDSVIREVIKLEQGF